MKRTIALTAALANAFMVGAAETGVATEVASTNKPKISVRETVRRINMREHGGYVRQPGSAKGVFVVLNAQKAVAASEIDKALDVIDRRIRAQARQVVAKDVTQENIGRKIKEVGGAAGVAVVEASPTAPALLSATEDGWAIVNVSRLSADNPKPEVLATRVRREVLRGFSFAVGGVYGARGDALMQPVREPKDLDSLVREDFAVTMMQTFSLVMPYYGMKPWHERRYDKACEEGWASQPTNDYQKAIWEKVHAIPQKPIKIEFDPKIDKK